MHMLLILLALCLRKTNGIRYLLSITYAFAGNGWLDACAEIGTVQRLNLELQQTAVAENGGERLAEFVAHSGQQRTLGAIGSLGLLLCVLELERHLLSCGHVVQHQQLPVVAALAVVDRCNPQLEVARVPALTVRDLRASVLGRRAGGEQVG